jgi:hypothetical protein
MNTAYVNINGIQSPLGGGPEPAGVSIAYVLLSPDNTVVASDYENENSYVNFEYGASIEDIQNSIVTKIRSANEDPDIHVVFIPKGI